MQRLDPRAPDGNVDGEHGVGSVKCLRPDDGYVPRLYLLPRALRVHR
jgi:hypothetical protein